MPERRRTFGPVVLLGLAGAGLAAVSSANTWVTGDGGVSGPGVVGIAQGEYGESPLAAALALVVLAAWGALLVTRGRFRRAVAALGVLAALAFAVTTALAPGQLKDALTEQLRAMEGTATEPALSLTAWWWAALVAAVVCVATTSAAVAWVPQWPEMGTRYDAPTAVGPGGGERPAPSDNLDIWKALDEGRDPTA